MKKLFRSTTTVVGTNEPMVDWYECETEAQARAAWGDDCRRYGLPMETTTVAFDECDPETLKPKLTIPQT